MVFVKKKTTVPKIIFLAGLVASMAGLAAWSGCEREHEGVLVIEWTVTSPIPNDPDPCSTAGISSMEVTVGHRDDTETPPAFVFPCSAGQARLPLTEGIYRVTLSKLTPGGNIAIARFDSVEVLGDTVRDWQGPYPPDPPDANRILVPWCGDGLVEADELCDDATANSDTEPDACRTDCTLPHCGDGVLDSSEQCDTTALGEATCESLGFVGGALSCRTDCRYDTSDCKAPRADLTVAWTVTAPDGVTPSDCPSQEIARVRYALTDPDGRPVMEGYAVCLNGSTKLSDLAFDTYDVYLQGLDGQGWIVASGTAFHHTHDNLEGTTVTVTLQPNQ